MTQGNTSWEYLAWDLKNELIEMGKIKIESNRFKDALIDLDKAINVFPKDSFIFIKNGKEKENNRDINGAKDYYDKAIKFLLIYIYRGYVKSRIGDIKGAVKDYEKAETLKKKYYYLFFLRARLNEKNKNYKGALKDYDDAIYFNKNKTKKLFFKRALIKTEIGDHEGAIKDLNIAINYYPKNSQFYKTRGIVKIKKNFFVSAIADFDVLINNDPKDASGYFYRGLSKKSLANSSRIKGLKSKINYLKDSNKDLKKAVGKISFNRFKYQIETLIKDNEESIKIINKIYTKNLNRKNNYQENQE